MLEVDSLGPRAGHDVARLVDIKASWLGNCPNPPCSCVSHTELPNGAVECQSCGTRWMPRHNQPPMPLLWEGDNA